MRLDDLLARAAGSSLVAGAVPDGDIAGLTADSRAVRPGFVFAALPGAKLDGRAFIADAARQGAAAILAPHGTALPDGVSLPLIAAEDARRVLALMAAALHAPQPAVAVAVTGSGSPSGMLVAESRVIVVGEVTATVTGGAVLLVQPLAPV